MTHSEFAEGLRLVADWFEAHPEVELPSAEISCYRLHSKTTAGITARALSDHGRCEKVFSDTLVELSRMFGVVKLAYYGTRSNVCEQVRVGTRVVPEQYVAPKPATEGHVVPEHEEAVYEWRCAPLLGKPDVEVTEEQPTLTDGGMPVLEAEYVDIPF